MTRLLSQWDCSSGFILFLVLVFLQLVFVLLAAVTSTAQGEPQNITVRQTLGVLS